METKIQYVGMHQYIKKTNLMKYATAKAKAELNDKLLLVNRGYYEKEREISLRLYFRRDNKGNTIIRIRCPINPFPIRGEFIPSNIKHIKEALKADGWEYKGSVDLREFNVNM